MLRLLGCGLIAFFVALVDSFITDAHSFSDLHWWGKFFCLIVIGVIGSWFILLTIDTIKKK